MTLGTMEYASPEQVRGQPTDQRTDLWSLGVMLYEMLTGVSPFRSSGDAASVMLSVLRREPEPASRVNPELPRATDEVLARLLAKDAGARFGAALEVEGALGALSCGAPVPRMPAERASGVATRPGLPAVSLQPGAEIPHKLPRPATPLVGRQDELALLDMYLQDPACQIVTLLGLGGTGKTRLSIAAAREQLSKPIFTDGVFFAPLEALASASLIPTSVAEALSLELQGGAEPLEQVVRYIGDKHVLLVLDNYEHLLAQHPEGTEGALVASELVQGCPNLKLLVTSRERLNLSEEWVLPLQGLPYPRDEVESLEAARSFGAVELFIQRARRVEPSFTPSREDLPHLVTICQRVTGLPLGIELAAVWVRMMPCAEIAREIGRNLDFLTTAVRNVAERHRSVRAVFEGSWGLLGLEEQTVLRKLSVFRGGFTREAAQEVTGAPLETLAGLVDKSLLQTAASGRYDQHPLLYGYTREKLAEHPEEQSRVEENHGTYYLHFLQEQGEEVRGPKQQEALEAIERELENIRTAWYWAARNARTKELRQTVEPLRVFYDQRGRIQEGIEAFSHALSKLSASILKHHLPLGQISVNLAYLYLRLGHYEQVVQLAQRGLALLRPLHEIKDIVLGLNVLGAVAGSTGDYIKAKTDFEEALAIAIKEKDNQAIAVCLDNLASVEEWLGNYSQAKQFYQNSLSLSRQLNNHSQVVMNLNNLGTLMLNTSNPEAAIPILQEGLELAKKISLQRMLPFFLANLGLAFYQLQNYTQAKILYTDALPKVQEHGEKSLEAGIMAELGRIATALNNYSQAQEHFKQSLERSYTIQDVPTMLYTIVRLGESYAIQGQDKEAAGLLNLALRHSATKQEDKDLARQLLEDLQEHLSPETMAEALEWGKTANLEEVVEEVLRQLETEVPPEGSAS